MYISELGSPQSDRALVAAMLSGEQSAWRSFVARYGKLLRDCVDAWTRHEHLDARWWRLKTRFVLEGQTFWCTEATQEALAWLYSELAHTEKERNLLRKYEADNAPPALEVFLRKELKVRSFAHLDCRYALFQKREALPPAFEKVDKNKINALRRFAQNKSDAEIANDEKLNLSLAKVQALRKIYYEREVFRMLRWEKGEDEIAQRLRLSPEEVTSIKLALGEKFFSAARLRGKLEHGTKQEKEIYLLFKQGLSETQIAAAKKITLAEVKARREAILAALINDRQLPFALHELHGRRQNVFALLKFGLAEEQIVKELEITSGELQEIKEEIYARLLAGSLLGRWRLDDEPPEEIAEDAPLTYEELALLENAVQRFRRAWQRLKPKDQLLLRLHYEQELNRTEILVLCLKADYPLFDNEKLDEETWQDADKRMRERLLKKVDKAIETAKLHFWRLLLDEYPDFEPAAKAAGMSEIIKLLLKILEQWQNGEEEN